MRSTREPSAGFTLLELIIAFSLLALFILPTLELVHQARVRTHHYTLKREVQDLAQRKLFDRIYMYSEETVLSGAMSEMSGSFTEEGHADWEWEIPYPQLINQGEQVLLEYTIRVYAPQLSQGSGSGGSSGSSGEESSMISDFFGSLIGQGGGASRSLGSFYADPSGRQPSYELTTWTFPSESWYDEQQALAEQGLDTGYYGSSGGGYGGY
jgi:hypothetical protein